MVGVYIDSKLTDYTMNYYNNNYEEDEKNKNTQALLKRAMDFLNKTTGTDLSFNYPHRAHHTIHSYDEWIDIDNEVNFHKFNDSIVCISSDDDEEEIDTFDEIQNMGYPSVTIITNKLKIENLPTRVWSVEHEKDQTICICCTDYNDLYKKTFNGTKFRLTLNGEDSPIHCPACCEAIEKKTLAKHFKDICTVFRV